MSHAEENKKVHAEFRSWLKKQRTRNDPVADFACDFLDDDCAKGLRTLSSIDRHLIEKHGADSDVLAARDRAWREFVEAKKPFAKKSSSSKSVAQQDGCMRASVTIDTDDLIEGLVAELDHKKLLKFMKEIDERVCDLKFTQDLAKHFKKVVDKERQAT